MSTFEDRENKVKSFIESVQEQRALQEEEDAFQNTTDYKLKQLEKSEDHAKDICLDTIFAKVYKDAIPLSDAYKDANAEDLDAAFKDFMNTRCPEGMEYYVKEAIRRKSPFAKKVLEAVNDLVDDHYRQTALDIENSKPEDFVFSTTDDVRRKLDLIGQDLSTSEIAQRVKDNVKETALSEISRAKKEKDTIKNIEAELANNINVDTPAKVQESEEYYGINQTRDYVPTLFGGIMINKMNKISPVYESGEMQNVYTYDALADFGIHSPVNENGGSYATEGELAFIESVKEYTALSVLKALRMENFDKYRVADLAQEYAQAR